MNFTIKDMFNLDECFERAIFEGLQYPWEALPKIKDFLLGFSKTLPKDFERIDEFVWVGKGTTIEKTVTIKGPAIIGYNCELRQCAFIRDSVIIGNECVIGNSTELKNSLLFNKVQVPHFNYIGDSILGYKAHTGAGVICSNLKSTGGTVKIKAADTYIETGLRKFGAMIGDNAEIGCNSVLNPGAVIGRNSIVYPLTSVKGYVPGNHILKNAGELVIRRIDS
ncbi:MAG: UDP-N-acetylglucosamine pyrophosphorylase [Clostridiaceae bacterium]|jgi:NDP-sugar pyrophosphorylase family protein|nr:UDP-N-acetylglucosamine pyrophosphorylase [Clostridiaceae bacterium]